MKNGDVYEEFIEQLIEQNIARDVKWLVSYIHTETGTLYSDMHIHEMRQRVLLQHKRADRFEHREELWAGGLSDQAI